jgi:hypothetical protein
MSWCHVLMKKLCTRGMLERTLWTEEKLDKLQDWSHVRKLTCFYSRTQFPPTLTEVAFYGEKQEKSYSIPLSLPDALQTLKCDDQCIGPLFTLPPKLTRLSFSAWYATGFNSSINLPSTLLFGFGSWF